MKPRPQPSIEPWPWRRALAFMAAASVLCWGLVLGAVLAAIGALS